MHASLRESMTRFEDIAIRSHLETPFVVSLLLCDFHVELEGPAAVNLEYCKASPTCCIMVSTWMWWIYELQTSERTAGAKSDVVSWVPSHFVEAITESESD